MTTQSKKTIFITGASSGLGNATTKLFASRGWRVLATMRRPEAKTDMAGLTGVELLPLDVTDPAQITSAVARATAAGPVDVVFNNAGYGISGPLEGLSDAQIERSIQTNLLGPIRVTKAFIPHFRQNSGGLFINTTSIGGLITVPLNAMYHATKWGLEGWSECMAFELSQVGIGMKIVEPGGMKTDFFSRSLDVGNHPAYRDLLDRVMGAITDEHQMQQYSEPEQIAEVVYQAATDGTDQLRYLAGADAKATYETRLRLGEEQFRKATAQQFFGTT
ncbi:SDR family oxidoreductase [Nocardia sp. NPDC101769]|uniref:SDR family oxidoreductase n=1 Tax=Nocardia sp. NPDC101769 TaxID=3364333 RepID=UPI0037FC8FED